MRQIQLFTWRKKRGGIEYASRPRRENSSQRAARARVQRSELASAQNESVQQFARRLLNFRLPATNFFTVSAHALCVLLDFRLQARDLSPGPAQFLTRFFVQIRSLDALIQEVRLLPVRQVERKSLLSLVADNAYWNATTLPAAQSVTEISRVVDSLAVDANDDVSRVEAGFFSAAAFVH